MGDKNNFEKLIGEKEGEFTMTNYEKSDYQEYLEEEMFPYKEDKEAFGYLKTEKEMNVLNNYRNFAFDFIKTSHSSRLLFPDSERPHFKVMKYEMSKFVENYQYEKLVKDKKRDQTYENFQANLLTSTEKFRNEAMKNNQKNLEISEMAYNLSEGTVGFDKL